MAKTTAPNMALTTNIATSLSNAYRLWNKAHTA